MGRHVRYRLSDVIDWEAERVDEPRDTTQRRVPARGVAEPIADRDDRVIDNGRVRNER